ncbi:TolC family protein [Massilia sp. TS11]|uniref:TolC family protein n=1 Tax=Massilia sp. TS11 TaxID=2908003 RepID=UPI001EDAC9C3|nr:TolC family protein [Massilia sp. TS11]MCG2586358.1 TolC family protein [Massilia sp. TS11]
MMRPLFLSLLLASAAAQAAEGLALRDAIALGLQRSPDIQLQRYAEGASAGARKSSEAAFDTVLTASAGQNRDLRPLRADERARFLAAGVDQDLNVNSYSLGASRQLENGYVLTGAYALTSTRDDVQQAQNIPRQNVDKLSFGLRLPLQKNAGREALAVRNATGLEYQASLRDTEQVVARTVLAVVQAYWDWASRQASAQVALGAEQRVRQLQRETEKLVAADELPPAELNLMQAAVKERETARIGAEQKARDGRFALARLFGMDAVATEALPLPAEILPEQAGASLLESLRQQALERRADLQALRLREQAAQERLAGARLATRPTVDLELGAYYAGLKEGTRANPAAFDPTARTAGPGLSAKLSFSLPMANAATEGPLLTALANADSARLRREALEQSILANVEAAYGNLRAVEAQLASSAVSVERYRAALRDTVTKRQLGTATLIDVLNVEDRLNNAIQGRLAYQLAYVQARATILYETGRLLKPEGQGFTVALEQLLP